MDEEEFWGKRGGKMELMITNQYGKEKVMDSVNRNFLLTVMMCFAFLFAVGSAYAWEANTDRPGMDYKNFDLSIAKPEVCENACKEDGENCRAWTYVRPGVQGEKARCWLKKGVPAAKQNRCCVSGVLLPNISGEKQSVIPITVPSPKSPETSPIPLPSPKSPD